MNNLKSILKHSFTIVLLLVLSTFATDVASAKTIYQSNSFIDSNILDYFDNVYKRENYKNYLLATEYVQISQYSYTTYYYMCLTNDSIDTSNTLSVSSSCDKMYVYYRQNNVYTLESYNDSSLTVQNSVYYSVTNKNATDKLLICLNIGLFSLFLLIVIFKLFRS